MFIKSKMEKDNDPTGSDRHLPTVLLLRRSPTIDLLETKFSQHFTLLEPWAHSPPLPLHLFLSSHAASVSALISSANGPPITPDLLDLLPSLQFIATSSAGLDHVDLPECRRRRVAVANASKAFADDAADMAVGLFVDVMRRVSASNRYVREGLWPLKGDYPLGSKIGGKKVGIVGLGNIGLGVARRLEAFGCVVLYNSRKERAGLSYRFYSNVCELAAECDALIVCCALTEETRHMINKEVLSALGRDGVIVNVARGAIIDEKEMVRCLVSREIGGAGLDVFENEPDVPKELFGLDNVVLSPHQAVVTPESMAGLGDVVTENLEAFFANKPLVSPVVIN